MESLQETRLARIAPSVAEPGEYWAKIAMQAGNGERFTLNICFRDQAHFNDEMMKFLNASSHHILLQDALGDRVVVKRDHVLYIVAADEELRG